jgi:hypothetical protein
LSLLQDFMFNGEADHLLVLLMKKNWGSEVAKKVK